MSTYEYLTTREALYMDRDNATTGGIRGLRGADADKVGNRTAVEITRTRAGNARKPENTWDARTGMAEHGKAIERVELAKDADPGVIEVFYADGTTDILHPGDLLCVERPIGGRSETV